MGYTVVYLSFMTVFLNKDSKNCMNIQSYSNILYVDDLRI